MHIVVNGASGFVGRAIVPALAQAGHEGWIISRRPVPSSLPSWQSRSRDAAFSVDAGPMPAGSINVVIHLEVKQHVVTPTARDILEFESVNVRGAQQWLDWCSKNDVRNFVYFSSIKAVRPALTGPTLESAGGPHGSYYGASKWAAELQVAEWVRQDPRRSALILRPAVVYGPGNTGNMATMIDAIQRGRFFLVGPNNNIKSLVSLRNLTSAVIHLVSRMVPGNCDIYNLTDPTSFTVREIDTLVRQELGMRGESKTIPLAIAKVAAAIGDIGQKIIHRAFPLNSHRLAALLEQTYFPCDKLLATGFVHPEATVDAIRRLVAHRRD